MKPTKGAAMTVSNRPETVQDVKGERPPRGQIAFAKLILKREREGKGKIRVTDEMRRVASFDL